jgi:hypothetical protein
MIYHSTAVKIRWMFPLKIKSMGYIGLIIMESRHEVEVSQKDVKYQERSSYVFCIKCVVVRIFVIVKNKHKKKTKQTHHKETYGCSSKRA